MASFIGGSAVAMARQISEGFTMVSPPVLKRLQVAQLEQLLFELDKKLRESRCEIVDVEDQPALQKRNRRMSRLESALRMVKHSAQQKRRKRI